MRLADSPGTPSRSAASPRAAGCTAAKPATAPPRASRAALPRTARNWPSGVLPASTPSEPPPPQSACTGRSAPSRSGWPCNELAVAPTTATSGSTAAGTPRSTEPRSPQQERQALRASHLAVQLAATRPPRASASTCASTLAATLAETPASVRGLLRADKLLLPARKPVTHLKPTCNGQPSAAATTAPNSKAARMIASGATTSSSQLPLTASESQVRSLRSASP
mmetsp:Transcript_54814/g.170086  ORF Transcript_54814/g.170086 Transcript_54814/m.170086 type:complete len:224 (+) Transcript_54814:369-1040(+)